MDENNALQNALLKKGHGTKTHGVKINTIINKTKRALIVTIKNDNKGHRTQLKPPKIQNSYKDRSINQQTNQQEKSKTKNRRIDAATAKFWN